MLVNETTSDWEHMGCHTNRAASHLHAVALSVLQHIPVCIGEALHPYWYLGGSHRGVVRVLIDLEVGFQDFMLHNFTQQCNTRGASAVSKNNSDAARREIIRKLILHLKTRIKFFGEKLDH